ncbi:YbhN family protein [Dactylosporangium sp. NPDC005572]|uniref:lysylphosphatidylglycerol synthase transmembrane domain-containing protein n=1 Tax=Dactylosporangium sp. NPDC005572 TaxID=3156889 RepID=UPI0033B4FF32
MTARRWLRPAAVAVVAAVLAVEVRFGWPALTGALAQLRTPHPGWLLVAVGAALASMRAYASMQGRLLRSAGVRVPMAQQLALAYAAHSLSVTLPGGPAFSTGLNYRQMRRFGASPAVTSWCIALSGLLSAAALAVITAAGAVTAHGAPRWPALAALAAAVALATAGVRRLARTPDALAPVLAVVNRVRRRPPGHGADRLAEFLGQLRATRLTPAHATVAAGYALLNWLLDAACLWLCLHAVAGGVGPGRLLLAYCAGMAAGTVTIVPAGLGIIDGALVLGLTTAGAATSAAVAGVVLYRLVSFGFIIALGWLALLLIRRRESTKDGPLHRSAHSGEHRPAVP